MRTTRSPRVATALAVLALSGGATLIAAATPATGQEPPTIRVDRTGTAAGETLSVTGEGWTAGTMVLVELCGHAALGGSVDCDVSHGRLVAAGADGAVFTTVVVGLPPKPCPCVVRAVDQSSGAIALADIAVQGVATVPLDASPESPLPVRAVEVIDVGLERTSQIASWFGGRARWTLTFTLRNVGTVDLRDPPLSIAIGKDADPSGLVDPPDVGVLAPNEERTFTVPVRTQPLAVGGYTVKIEVHGFAEPVVARIDATTYPWGLAVVALVVLQVALVVVRNRVRRRITSEPLVTPATTDEQVAVLDLTEPTIDLVEPRGVPVVDTPAEPELEPDVQPVRAGPIALGPATGPAAPAAGVAPVLDLTDRPDEADAATTDVAATATVSATHLATASELVEAVQHRSNQLDELLTSLRRRRDAITDATARGSTLTALEGASLATRLRSMADELSEITAIADHALTEAIGALEVVSASTAAIVDAATRHRDAVAVDVDPPQAEDPPANGVLANGVSGPAPENDFLSRTIRDAVSRALRS